MKTNFRILAAGALCALAAPLNLLAQSEPIIAVDITKVGVVVKMVGSTDCPRIFESAVSSIVMISSLPTPTST